MNPVVQLTISVALVVIAARMWPPLLYWLVGFFLLIGAIKGMRRLVRWSRRHTKSVRIGRLIACLLVPAAWLAVAAIADRFHPSKISAVSIVLCFICACIAIGLLVSAADWCHRYLHRR